MKKNIAIITDDSFDLTEKEISKYHIFTVKLPIIFKGRVKYSFNWKSLSKFYKEISSLKQPPTTSQPSQGDIINIFNKIKSEGYKQAIFLCLSSGISGTYNSLLNLAKNYQGLKITVWDTKITLRVAAQQALLAAQLSHEGKSINFILKKLSKLRNSCQVYLVVNNIKYLQRTGRLSGGFALVAGLLNIKPILFFNNKGEIIAISKQRKIKGVWKWLNKKLISSLKKSQEPIKIMLADADNRQLTNEWNKKIKNLHPNIKTELININPLIGVHTGKKAIGFVIIQDWKNLI